MMQINDRILVTGGRGFVGTNLIAYLKRTGFRNIFWPTDYNLTSMDDASALLSETRPDYVFHLAAKVFGLGGNLAHQSESFLQNTLVNTNVIKACVTHKVKKIVAMGSVAMYPETAYENYFKEENLWDGPTHDSEWGYANAKRGMLAYLIACERSHGLAFACPLSTNLYGPHDRFDIETGHVIPSLIRKFFEAKRDGKAVEVWGDGSSTRDLLYVDDAVIMLHHIMNSVPGVTNLVTGQSFSIRHVVEILSECSGVSNVTWNNQKPMGQVERSYRAPDYADQYVKHKLRKALCATYDWYVANEKVARKS